MRKPQAAILGEDRDTGELVRGLSDLGTGQSGQGPELFDRRAIPKNGQRCCQRTRGRREPPRRATMERVTTRGPIACTASTLAVVGSVRSLTSSSSSADSKKGLPPVAV